MLEPAFHWARGDESIGFSKAVVCSNCDHIKFYIDDKLVADADPDRTQFATFATPPSWFNYENSSIVWGDLRIEGYIQGKLAITKNLSGKGVDTKFMLLPDDTELVADGVDTTRLVLRVTDEFGAIRSFANDAIKLDLEGPAEIIGDNPFSLIGGTGAIWIRAKEQPGKVRISAVHPWLGVQQVEISIVASPQEAI